ncbi:MAG: 3-deoxy-manno-octulosonate cytidylyltransferase [Legionellales bacterium]|nr:3-deoxy-manno-octulosonate cytidylyltransferase [Legionellales bacterium]
MNTVIVIPARYGSIRFPGKPLALLAGQTMLERVVCIAHRAAQQMGNTQVLVATDDARIQTHAQALKVDCIMTPTDCPTGTDRILHALTQLPNPPELVVNLQCDVPLIPVDWVVQMITALRQESVQVVTPAIQLTWELLDQLREAKTTSPFSGTTVAINQKNQAYWFSKNIIPAIRDEALLRADTLYSPVFRHIGLYGYTFSTLNEYVQLAQTPYEQLESLEQLRLLEHGYNIRIIKVTQGYYPSLSGIDTPADAERAEALLHQLGEVNE